MKGANNSRFDLIYILPAFASAAGRLEIYFFTYIDHDTAITFAEQNYGQ